MILPLRERFTSILLLLLLLLVNQHVLGASLPNGVDQGDYFIVPIGGARVKEYGFLSILPTVVQLHSKPKTSVVYKYSPLVSGMAFDSNTGLFIFNPGVGLAGTNYTIQRNSTFYNQQTSKTMTQTDLITISVASMEKLASNNVLLQQDNFTTSTGLGSGWVSIQGSHLISSNSLTINPNTITISQINITSSDVTFQIISNSYSTSPGRGFIFNYIDANNYYEIQLQNPPPLTVTRVLNGKRTVILSSSLLVGASGSPVTTNHKIYVKKVNNSIQIFIGQLSIGNGDYLVSVTDSDSNAMNVFYSTNGKIGFFDKYTQSGSRFKILKVQVWKGKVLHTYSIPPQMFWVHKGGSDLNNGKTYNTGWQTISRAQYMLFPDDSLFIYPGTYRETVKIQTNSIPGHPIIIKGVNNQVILDGSYPINMNTVQSVSTTLPFKIFSAPLQRDSALVNSDNNNLILAMRPLPSNVNDYYAIDNYLTVITNNTNFTPPNSLLQYMKLDETFRFKADGTKVSDSYWVGATIFHYVTANTVTIRRKILYYNNVTNVIGVEITKTPFVVNDKYSMANHPGLISKIGQYAVVNSTVYVSASKLPTNIQVSILQTGINIFASEYYIFNNLNATRFESYGVLCNFCSKTQFLNVSSYYNNYAGIGISAADNILIDGGEYSYNSGSGVNFFYRGSYNCTVQNAYIHRNLDNGIWAGDELDGQLFTCFNIRIRKNRIGPHTSELFHADNIQFTNSHDIYIENNTLINTGSFSGGRQNMWNQNGGRMTFKGNSIIGGPVGINWSSEVKMYNNLFYNVWFRFLVLDDTITVGEKSTVYWKNLFQDIKYMTNQNANALIWNKNQTLVKAVQALTDESQLTSSLKLEIYAQINRVITNTSLLIQYNDIIPLLNTTHGVAFPYWTAITKRGLISSVNGSVSSKIFTDTTLYNEVIGLNRAILDELALDLRVKKSLVTYYSRTVDIKNNVFVNSPIQKPTTTLFSLTPYWNIDHNYVMTDTSVVPYWQYIDWPSVMDVKKNIYETNKKNLAFYFNNSTAIDFNLNCNVTSGFTLIDKGVLVDGISYNGLSNDIGAFESNCSASSSIVVTAALDANNLMNNQVIIGDQSSSSNTSIFSVKIMLLLISMLLCLQ